MKVSIVIHGKEIELTQDEAKMLTHQLDGVSWNGRYKLSHHPVYPDPQPFAPNARVGNYPNAPLIPFPIRTISNKRGE